MSKGDIVAMDRAYIDYEKLEALTQREVLYVTKRNERRILKYNIMEDCMYADNRRSYRLHLYNMSHSPRFWRLEILIHHARIITYADTKKHKLVALLTNDMESWPNEIIEIHRKRAGKLNCCSGEIKQTPCWNTSYGESANANKIQIWVTCAFSQSASDGNGKRDWTRFLEGPGILPLMMRDYAYVLCWFLQPV